MSENELLDRIAIDPNICSGKPHIRKTYMKVSTVLELLTEGWDSNQIIDEYPYLNIDDIKACLVYAKKILKKNG